MIKQADKIKKTLDLIKECKKLDEPIKSDKWRNLSFTKDGRSHLGNLIHASEESAFEVHKNAMKGSNQCIACACADHDTWDKTEHSHTIQMPVKE